MESLALPIIIATSIGLLAWGIAQIIGSIADPEKRKLKKRLSSESSFALPQIERRGITRQQIKATGLSAKLIQFEPLGRFYLVLCQGYPDLSLVKFLCISLGIGFGVYFVALAILPSTLMAVGLALFGAYMPFMIVLGKRSRRQKMISLQLPEALDFLSRVLRAGHSLSTGLQMMADELPQPLASEFRRAYDQHSLGNSLEDALKDMAARVESTDFAFFITAVLIQRQTGGDLSEVLTNISSMIRGRIRLSQHVKAKTAEGRFTGYILVAFPAVMFCLAYAMNPDYGAVLLKTNEGLKMLGIAFGLQMAGLWAIRKLTTVKV